MAETPGPELREAAAAYAWRGWPVFPCAEREKVPCKEKGLFEHGVLDAKTSPFWIKQFWSRWPRANVGLAVGEDAGFWVLDADIKPASADKPAEDGFATLKQLEELFGEPLPETLGQNTPSGGRHWLFKWPDRPVKNSARSRLGPGLDTRSTGGYILAPPSIHPNGGRYAWIGGVESVPILPAPEWVIRLLIGDPDDLDWLRQRLDGKELPAFLAKRIGKPVPPAAKAAAAKAERVSAYARAALDDECKRVRQTGPGNQNNTLNEAAFKLGGLVGSGALPEDLVFQHLMAAALQWSIDPRKGGWKPEHLDKIIRGGIEAGRKHPRDMPEPREPQRRFTPRRSRRGVPASPAAVGVQMAAGRTLWGTRQPLDGTPAAAFLRAKGVAPEDAGPWFGFAEVDYLHGPEGAEPVCVGRFPALLAGMARWPDRDGRPEVRAVLASFITADGQPATIHDPVTGEALPSRKLIGAWHGTAVRLGRLAGERLHVATGALIGIQTRLAYPDVPVWIGGPMGALTHLVLPECVRDVIIVGAGSASAEAQARVARALSGADGRVTVRIPRPTRVLEGVP